MPKKKRRTADTVAQAKLEELRALYTEWSKAPSRPIDLVLKTFKILRVEPAYYDC